MSYELPPIVKLADRLLVDVEEASARLARVHRYGFGADLRAAVFKLATFAHKAWTEREQRGAWIAQLDAAVDDVKLRLNLGKTIRAFASFGQYEHLARTANELGKQVGGWHRQSKHLNGQNATPSAAAQRANSLSTRAASREANS